MTKLPRIGRGEFTRALVIENPDPTLDAHLRELGITPVRPAVTPNEDELVRILENDPFDLIFKRSRVEITPRVLDAAPNLFGVMLCCIGDDSVDKVACAERGVLVTNDPISNGRSVVELFVGELICLSRRVFEATRETDSHTFDKSQARRFEVQGKTLGVFGLGNIGKQVAQVAQQLGMRIVFHDNRDVAREVGETMGWQYVPTLEALFELSDIVTCHVSAYDHAGRSNEGVLQYEHFAAMRARGDDSPRIFINLARGNIYAAADLVRAVDEGHVSQAMVDVYPDEPKDKSSNWLNPYAAHPRIYGTPHIGAATLEAQPRIAAHVGRTTRMLSRCGTLRNCVFGGREEVGLDPTDTVRHYLTVVHSTCRGTKKAVDDAIFNAGASNIVSAHRDFDRYGIAYEVVGIDQLLSDDQLDAFVAHARDLTRRGDAIRAIRQI
ncbi:MAG: 3-phosphoglycerate dehydrogenase [Myxococcales bacterium]|nr:3-phosphoglycerate dehydrogenase [Myxococcales bacterium]MCB9532300.1 3-phosphoglycerate dehydrogenase [Myxococcales bacterium]